MNNLQCGDFDLNLNRDNVVQMNYVKTTELYGEFAD